MANRHYLTLLLLFCSFLTTSLFAQTPPANVQAWVVDNLPTGAHVLNELIVHYDMPVSADQVRDWIKTPVKGEPPVCNEWKKGISFTVEELVPKTDFLLRFPNGFPCDEGICDVIDPNSTIHNRVRSNEMWPNYLIGTGVSPTGPDCYPNDAEIDQVEDIMDIEQPVTPQQIEEESSDYDALWHCTPNYNMSVPYGDKRILIAVLDSGLDPTFHPDIFAGQRPDHRLDAYGHGTAVSGVILHEAYRQDKLASVYIKSFSVLGEDGTGKLSDLVALMGGPVTKDGYDIVNMSLGYQPLACDVSNTTAISSSLQELDQAGTFIVTSAGNNEQDLGASPQYPAAEPGLIYGITVGSLTCGDPERAQFSNFGSPEVDYLAPGEEILVPNATDNLFRCAKGTSFSAPLVTGMIAGYLSQEYSPDEVICLLRSGATAKGETDSNYGWAAAVDATTVCPEQPEYPDTPDDNEAEVLAKNLRVTTSNLELFPNPAHNVLRVNLPKQQELSPGTLQILDARGVPVLNPGYLAAGDNIDVSSLQPGIYFVRYQAEGQSLVQRFLKH